MGQKERNMLVPKQATCRLCNLTARNDEELADHVHHSHGSETAELTYFFIHGKEEVIGESK
ncbi:MAG: hypothetical protein DLM72_03850 [Candidatus Nitrosopolaris wilkensis]|nr:MAG: hypothetical protein DLM72_03850 [Candidatus Nitrosopolaris wilkensis]